MREITVFQSNNGDLSYFETVSADRLEERVTELHKRFPAPAFRFEITRS
ncbi:hypothetical protein [Streptomyces antimycoticus]|nr:hypothetical protein OG751_04270 [Streptomyces antimycoticus]